jgi:AAA domain-containing protein
MSVARARAAMLGREREAAALAEALATHAAAALHGAPGVGKTTLASAVAAREHAAGRLPPPLALSLAGLSGLRDLLEACARALGRRRPVAHDDAVAEELARLVGGAGVTLILDDADALEAAALARFLRALAARPRLRARVVVISRAPLLLADIAAVALGPLDDTTMRALIAAFEAQRGRTLHDELIERARGNPLALQLLLVAGVADMPDALARAVAALSPPARTMLALLATARRRFRLAELDAVLPDVAGALDELRRLFLVDEDDGRIGVGPRVEAAAAPLIGSPPPAVWTALATLSARALAAAPSDGDALLLACRARAQAGEPAAALALLSRHPHALESLPTAALESLVHELTVRLPSLTAEAQLVLAREQLRAGDIERACATLDLIAVRRPTGSLARRVQLLRMEALARFGDPGRAAHELSRADTAAAVAGDDYVAVGLAALAILRGEGAAGRTALRALAKKARGAPQLEAQRAAVMAMSYLCDERHARAVVWTRRARREYRETDAPSFVSFVSFVSMGEILSLLELGRIDEAAALATRFPVRERAPDEPLEPLGRDLGLLFAAAIDARRGELVSAMVTLEAIFEALDARADRLPRALLARYLARSCTMLGRFDRSEMYLRAASGAGAEPGLATMIPLCDREWALYDEARGHVDCARRRLRALAKSAPFNPLIAIDAWTLDADERAVPREAIGAPGLASYAAMRAAERALDRGDAAAAAAAADIAERRFREAGVHYENTRARLLRAEALLALGRGDEAERDAHEAGRLANDKGYAPLSVAAALVLAGAAARDGRLDARSTQLARAHASAATMAPGLATRQLSRMGLSRPPAHVVTLGERAWLVAAGAPTPVAADVIVDLDGFVVVGREQESWAAQRLELLALLAESRDAGVSLEEMYLTLWGGREYHPLHHRNMVYVALQRTRKALEALIGEEPLARVGDGRYRIADGLVVAVRRRAEPDVLARFGAAA